MTVTVIEADTVIVDTEEIILTGLAEGEVGDVIELVAKVMPENATNKAVVFSSSDLSIAKVDSYGKITALKGGMVTIKVASLSNPDAFDEFELEVTERERQEVVLGQPNVIKVGETLKIETRKYGNDKEIVYEIDNLEIAELLEEGTITALAVGELILQIRLGDDVHYEFIITITDSEIDELMQILVDNINFDLKYEVINYVGSNDGWFQQLENDDIAWHAGDGRNKAEFTDTGILATKEKAPLTISPDGYYMVDGIKTEVKAPTVNERLANNNDITAAGLWAVIIDGNYHIPATKYDASFNGNIVLNGGNYNGIGIETAVNRGSDVWLTWQMTAKLVADLLIQTGLSFDRVVLHNHFSGKPCPRTAMESDNFYVLMQMIEFEYQIRKMYKNYEITFISDSPLLDENGRVISIPMQDTVVTYTSTIKAELGNTTSVTTSSIVRGDYFNLKLL